MKNFARFQTPKYTYR